MKKDYVNFSDSDFPRGYLITFRCYGTWLHGHKDGSVDRYHRTYGTPMLLPSSQRMNHDRGLLKQSPVALDSNQRAAVEASVRDTCAIRRWSLWRLNVRTNHVYAVVSANTKPATVLATLKANATRSMREAGCWTSGLSPWAHRGSGKYLWSERDLGDAFAYVEYDQGEPPK